MVRNGIEFERYRETENGVVIGFLERDTSIEGYLCQRGWTHFHEGWKLRSFTNAEAIDFLGSTLPKGAWVSLNTDGAIIRVALPTHQEILGYPCYGSGGGAKGVQAAFYEDGTMRSFFPYENVTIDGIACLAYKPLVREGALIRFHPNGQLGHAMLAEETEIESVTYEAGSEVSFDAQGNVVL